MPQVNEISWTLLSFSALFFLTSLLMLTNFFPPLPFLVARVSFRPLFFSNLI